MSILIGLFINIIIIFSLYFSDSRFLNVSLVVLSFLLFLLMDLTSKNNEEKFARNLASRYILTAFFATLISYSVISVIKHDIVLESTAMMYVNIIFLCAYHIIYYSILFKKTNGLKKVQITRYKYLYWILSVLVLAFIILSLTR